MVAFGDLPDYVQELVIRKAAARYNIRSDYPNEVAGIFRFLRDQFYPGLDPGKRENRTRRTG